MDQADDVHAERVEEWREWLRDHHETSPGVWLISWKNSTGRPRVTYEDSVVEALAYGWIDSTQRTLDDQRVMQYFCRRKPTSGWSKLNKQRVEMLEASGRMQPAGRVAIDDAKRNGTWSLLDDVENLFVPDDLAAEFDSLPPAREHWDTFPPSVRRGMLQWIVLAKRPETRARRVQQVAEAASRGERAKQ